jgi:hypothetical protein
MICHEKWGYDDKRLVATLLGFEIHCSNCDLVVHAGRAFKLGYGDIAISHLVCCESGRDDEVALRRKGRTHLRPGAILSLSQRTATVPLFLRRGESEA